MLYLIGLGLADEKDISVKGLESVRKCSKVYLDSYTSLLQCSVKELESFYGCKIVLADREMTEQGDEKIIAEAAAGEVAFLVVGDVFSATTHIQLFKLAKEEGVLVKVINNASVLGAVGIVGLEQYKYGKTASISFDNPDLETPYEVLKGNLSLGLHTLFLLDLNPSEERFMTINEGLEILEKIEKRKKEKVIDKEMIFVGCARLGSDDFLIKKGLLEELKGFDFGKPPHCLIVPGKLHFMEEEMLGWW